MLRHRLREARATAHLTQAELAQRTGSAPPAISHWESGRRKPDADNLVKLCRALHCSADWLLGLPGHNEDTRLYKALADRIRRALGESP